MRSGEQQIIEFFESRSGFDHWWRDIDAVTKQEIREGIAAIHERIQHDAKLEGLREAYGLVPNWLGEVRRLLRERIAKLELEESQDVEGEMSV